jgi:hypothetical protein
MANNFDTFVNLSSYEQGELYTAPCDGYTRANSASGGNLTYRVYGNTGTGKYMTINNPSDTYSALFIRKGMRLELRVLTGNAEFEFFPLIL